MDVASIVSLCFELAFKYLPQFVSLIEQLVQAFKSAKAQVAVS